MALHISSKHQPSLLGKTILPGVQMIHVEGACEEKKDNTIVDTLKSSLGIKETIKPAVVKSEPVKSKSSKPLSDEAVRAIKRKEKNEEKDAQAKLLSKAMLKVFGDLSSEDLLRMCATLSCDADRFDTLVEMYAKHADESFDRYDQRSIVRNALAKVQDIASDRVAMEHGEFVVPEQAKTIRF